MTVSDQEFRDEYKPLAIPASFHEADTQEDKVIFALADLGEGSANDIINQLEKLQPGIKTEQLVAIVPTILNGLFEKGLLKGSEVQGEMQYNLSKITHENEGNVNPDLLAPGLD